MNESETRAELIDPKLKASGWGVVEGSRVLRELHSHKPAALETLKKSPLFKSFEIVSTANIKLHNESLNKELIHLIASYEKVNVSRERYEQYCWYGLYAPDEKFKTENNLADKWLTNMMILNQDIFKVIDLLDKEIAKLEKTNKGGK